MEKPENREDATEFIAILLKFVHSAQVHVIEELETLRMQLEQMRQKLTDIEATDPRIDVNLGKLLGMLIQEKLFGLNNGETQEVLRRHLEKSPTQTRRYLRQLVELGLMCETPTRPKRYSLSDTACQMLGI